MKRHQVPLGRRRPTIRRPHTGGTQHVQYLKGNRCGFPVTIGIVISPPIQATPEFWGHEETLKQTVQVACCALVLQPSMNYPPARLYLL